MFDLQKSTYEPQNGNSKQNNVKTPILVYKKDYVEKEGVPIELFYFHF